MTPCGNAYDRPVQSTHLSEAKGFPNKGVR
ncbi:hypothetical protein CCACVL1_21895 [Corchorus capsularis]|uniref:Uncharacterized protein n=1 Tax=Corchorus capsularis TaxID=210143 RepID=A0A1R3H1V7_COCAP|nr:hypothetical protein CCACVL1_21895 [Corchorus capsularis]